MRQNLKNTGVIFLVFCVFMGWCFQLHSQKTPEYQSTRILFVMDASGSMQGKWEADTKFKIARDILTDVLDSLYDQNQNIAFGLRLFGHLSPKEEQNCEDTRLEIPFSRDNLPAFRTTLTNVVPKGQTPLTYSLSQATDDFPDDPTAKNVIILITDGLESCDGDPCSITPQLKQNNIALRPFVIGLGLDDDEDGFDCLGKFLNANDKPSLQKVMNVVISQAMNKTTSEIRLLDENGKPTIYDMPMTLYNSRTNEPEMNLYNAEGYREGADTLYLSPVIDYDIQVHSLPPVWKRNITIDPGNHNIIPIDLPLGYLKVERKGFKRMNDAHCVIRSSGDHQLLKVFQINEYKRILAGTYTLEILTLPRIIKKISVTGGKTATIEVPQAGKAVFSSSRQGIYSIYEMEDGEPQLIYENEQLKKKETLEILPGKYFAVYRQYKYKSSELTEIKHFTIDQGSTVSIWF